MEREKLIDEARNAAIEAAVADAVAKGTRFQGIQTLAIGAIGIAVWDAAIEYSAASSWVPVGERNPDSGEYFVTCVGGYVAEAYFTDRWYSSEDDMEMTAERFNQVTAWMPKPPPFGGTNES